MYPRRGRSRGLRAARWLAPIFLALLSSSCLLHHHVVGGGPNGLGSESIRQYYIFFGLLRLNEADSQRLTENATGYRVVTKYSFTDILLTPLLLPLTVTSRTVTVYR